MSPDLLSSFISFFLTLLVFSYLLGDNPLFRVAIHVFVGVSAGYVAAVTWYQVLWSKLFLPLLTGPTNERLLLVIPLLLGILLLMKISSPLSKLGSPAVAFMVGVAAAVAVGGAVMGTLFPQVQATIDPFNLHGAAASGSNPIERILTGSIFLIGTVSTLAYFHFGAKSTPDGSVRRNRLIGGIAWVGRVFIAITFGVLFAGVFVAALTAFIERLHFLQNAIQSF